MQAGVGNHLPNDGTELTHGQLLGDQKLGLVQDTKVLLILGSFHDDLWVMCVCVVCVEGCVRGEVI